jgi:hypothetical protein
MSTGIPPARYAHADIVGVTARQLHAAYSFITETDLMTKLLSALTFAALAAFAFNATAASHAGAAPAAKASAPAAKASAPMAKASAPAKMEEKKK